MTSDHGFKVSLFEITNVNSLHTLRSILSWKYKLEKIEGEIKNEQSRETKLAALGMQDTGRRPSKQNTQHRKLRK
jgi:hypothetical protein